MITDRHNYVKTKWPESYMYYTKDATEIKAAQARSIALLETIIENKKIELTINKRF